MENLQNRNKRERVVARHYRELLVWQKSMDLASEIYRLTQELPDGEKYGLISQLRRAAVSIPSNIAEGQGRMTVGEFLQALGHARGSLHEVETQLLLIDKMRLCESKSLEPVLSMVAEAGKLLNGLIRSLKS